jgi:putative pyoverdin transport system ATP-binding/permease protein
MKSLSQIYGTISFMAKCSGNIKHTRRTLAVVILTSIITGLSSTALLALITSGLHSNSANLQSLLWPFIGLCLVLPASRSLSSVLLNRFVTSAGMELRMGLCRRILATPLRFLEELGAHRLLASLTDDIPAITATLASLPMLCMQLTIVLGCMTYLLWLSPKLFLILLAFVTVGVVSYRIPMTKSLKLFRLFRKEWDALFKSLQALIGGIKELKLHHRRSEALLWERIEPISIAHRNYNIRANTIATIASSWGQILFFILIGLLLFGLRRGDSVNLQVLTGYTLTVLFMMGPLEAVLNTIGGWTRAAVAIERVKELGLLLPTPSFKSTGDSKPLSWEKLELVNLTHTYHREDENAGYTLGPLNLKIRRGEMIFVTGGNGTGKTTFAKLISGLYAPQDGEILLDGQPITDETRDLYSQNFSMVFSDFYLFETLLGLQEAELDTKANDYLVKLKLSNKVKIKDGAFDTLELSQGQRKRLALLTAYLEDRSIYIFDEWAADQDPYFKQVFYFNLLPELKANGKKVLVITHDDRYFHLADRTIKLANGKIEYDQLEDGPQVPVFSDQSVEVLVPV